MVPINILNGSLPSSDRKDSRAVILGGLGNWTSVASIFRRILFIEPTKDHFPFQGYKFDKIVYRIYSPSYLEYFICFNVICKKVTVS